MYSIIYRATRIMVRSTYRSICVKPGRRVDDTIQTTNSQLSKSLLTYFSATTILGMRLLLVTLLLHMDPASCVSEHEASLLAEQRRPLEQYPSSIAHATPFVEALADEDFLPTWGFEIDGELIYRNSGIRIFKSITTKVKIVAVKVVTFRDRQHDEAVMMDFASKISGLKVSPSNWMLRCPSRLWRQYAGHGNGLLSWQP